MTSFLSYERTNDTSVYTSEKVNIRSKPKSNATNCYIMSGGGIPAKLDSTSNMGKVREREREKIDKQNLRTHDRLSKVKSSIPKQRTAAKITKLNNATGEKKTVEKQVPASQQMEYRQRREKRHIAETNRKLTSHLQKIYKSEARLKEHGVKTMDCNPIWSKRTNIYADKPDQQTIHTGVPKTAGCVSCGGCGLKTFFGADGLRVHQGSRSNMDPGHSVFYCNDVCAAVDWEVNRENINAQDTGGKGRKPSRRANYWVQSRAAVVARDMLRKAVQNNELPDLDRILSEIKLQRGVGARQNEEIRRALPGEKEEKRAQGGAEGEIARQKELIREGAIYQLEEYRRPEPDVWFGKEPPKGTAREQKARERRERRNADQEEIMRVRREGQVGGKGTLDKNMPSQEVIEVEKPRSTSTKYRGSSRLDLAGEGNGYADKGEMYRTTKDIERERDRVAAKSARVAANIANRGKKSKKLMDSKKEYETFREGERAREEEKRAKSGRRSVEEYKDPDGFEKRAVGIGGLEYDATASKRDGESKVAAEPRVSVVDKDDDPKLFRQSMDMIRLKQ